MSTKNITVKNIEAKNDTISLNFASLETLEEFERLNWKTLLFDKYVATYEIDGEEFTSTASGMNPEHELRCILGLCEEMSSAWTD